MIHVRSWRCRETNITRRPFLRRVPFLYLSNKWLQPLFTAIYPCKGTNNIGLTYCQSWDGGNPLQLAAMRSRIQLELNVQVGCLFWLVGIYIFFRTSHFFLLSSSSPVHNSKSWLHMHLSQVCLIPKSSRMTGDSSKAPPAETQLPRRHHWVHRDAGFPATENITQHAHYKMVRKTGQSKHNKQHAIGCE